MNTTLHTHYTHKIHQKHVNIPPKTVAKATAHDAHTTPICGYTLNIVFVVSLTSKMFTLNINTSIMPKSSSTTYPSFTFVWELRIRTYKGEQP